MADFISGFWNLYVMGLVAFGLVFCLIVLITNMMTRESGEPKLQGHVWDENLREYNNPLPRWWLFLFLGTVLFSIVYLLIFPGFGNRNSVPGGGDTGLRAEYAREMGNAEKQYGPTFEKHRNTDLVALANDPKAMETGKRLYLTYCVQCHGSAGKGAKGFPDLTDKDWLYGGDPEVIKASIADGRAFSNLDEKIAEGKMDAFAGQLTDDQITDVANYVRSLSGLSAEEDRAARGREVFAGRCVSCHGPDGRGALSMGAVFGVTFGAPNLTDNIWLHGNSLEAIKEGIARGRNIRDPGDPNGPNSLKNHMPAWKDFLGDAKVHILAAYVYSLSNK